MRTCCLWKQRENTNRHQKTAFLALTVKGRENRGVCVHLGVIEGNKACLPLQGREKVGWMWAGKGRIVFSLRQEGLGKVFISLYQHRKCLCLHIYLWHWKRQSLPLWLQGWNSFAQAQAKGRFILSFAFPCGRGWREVCLQTHRLLRKGKYTRSV